MPGEVRPLIDDLVKRHKLKGRGRPPHSAYYVSPEVLADITALVTMYDCVKREMRDFREVFRKVVERLQDDLEIDERKIQRFWNKRGLGRRPRR
jgi:hypothetical protein